MEKNARFVKHHGQTIQIKSEVQRSIIDEHWWSRNLQEWNTTSVSYDFGGEGIEKMQKINIVQKTTADSYVFSHLNLLDTQLAASPSLAPNDGIQPVRGGVELVKVDACTPARSSSSCSAWSLSKTLFMLMFIMSTASEVDIFLQHFFLIALPFRTYLKIRRQEVGITNHHINSIKSRSITVRGINTLCKFNKHLKIKFISIPFLWYTMHCLLGIFRVSMETIIKINAI